MDFRPASLIDYAALFPAAGQRQWKAARVQILGGPAWCLWQGDRRVGLCGLYPLHSGIFEAWLMLARKPSATALRRLLDRTATVCPDRIVITRVDDGNLAGRRLAALAGFWPVDEFLDGTTIRTWARPAIL